METHRALGLELGIAYGLLGLTEAALVQGDYVLANERLPIALRTTNRLTAARYLETLASLPLLQVEAAARLLGAANPQP